MTWYRLLHPTLGQLAAGPDLAPLTDLYWRLSQQGIRTRLVKAWLVIPKG